MRLDDDTITLTCSCGTPVNLSLAQARQSPTVHCPRGHAIKIEGADLDRGLNDLDRELRRFEQSLKRLGR